MVACMIQMPFGGIPLVTQHLVCKLTYGEDLLLHRTIGKGLQQGVCHYAFLNQSPAN